MCLTQGTRQSCETFLKCIYTNVDGLNAIKGSELSILMQLEDPDVVFIVETKLDGQDITSQYLTCNGYRIYRKDRNGHGGGVLLMVKEELETRDLVHITPEVEAVGCEVRQGNSVIPLLCVYRPPGAPERYNKMISQVVVDVSNLGTGHCRSNAPHSLRVTYLSVSP